MLDYLSFWTIEQYLSSLADYLLCPVLCCFNFPFHGKRICLNVCLHVHPPDRIMEKDSIQDIFQIQMEENKPGTQESHENAASNANLILL